MISGKAKIAGIMGWPVSHSLSPRLHNYWLQQHKIDGAYIPLPVKPEDLAKALLALPALGLRGCNLTIPHKEAALMLCHSLDPAARRIGAVNTVVVQADGRLEGRNTDAYGFAENLRAAGLSEGAGQTALVLGAGGAARAVIVALQDLGFSRVMLTNRTLARAAELAAQFSLPQCPVTALEWEAKEQALPESDLLVNSTALGMMGKDVLTLDLQRLRRKAVVTDIVYTPLRTPLLQQAEVLGHRSVDGLGMLLHQAGAGFHAWFGENPKVDEALRQEVLKQL